MFKTAMFRGLLPSDIQKITNCLRIKKEKFNTNEMIMSYTGNSTKIGVVISGTVDLVSDSYDGSRIVLERYGENARFGELFSPFARSENPCIIASSSCEVLLFQSKNLLSPCEHACDFHDLFLNNIIQLLTEKIRTQSERIEVLSSRSLRGKLMTYFETQANAENSRSFTLPFSLYALADYISVDRCAMQREMKKMRDEGLIASKGKCIELL